MGKYTFIADYKAAYPEPACRKSNPPCSVSQKEARLFKKGEVIDETEILYFTIPMNVLSQDKSVQTKLDENRDPWTGGIEWDKVFNIRNLFYLVLLVYLVYLFMKHVLPLAKKSFGKQ